jgi:phosphonate transport system permease protein
MNTNTSFEQYYQNIRMRQKRDTVAWSLVLLALYFTAGNAAEFNLNTIWHSLPNFFDYMRETMPTLHVSTLFADSHTKGSLAYWGYRLPIQLPLIWETLQLALAATLVSFVLATVFAFWRQVTPGRRRWSVLVSARWWHFYVPCRNWRGRLSL